MKPNTLMQTDQGSFNFTQMVLDRREEQNFKRDSGKKSRLDELRGKMAKLRGEATNVGALVQEMKSAMSRNKGNFVVSYTQSMESMRSRLEAIRSELQGMGAALKESRAMIRQDDEHHDDHHDHDHHEAELAHMDVETHEIERASEYARGRAGLHVLEQREDKEQARRNGYTAPIEADLHALLHNERPVSRAGNDAMQLGRSLDVISADFDRFQDEMQKLGVTELEGEQRFTRGEGAMRSVG